MEFALQGWTTDYLKLIMDGNGVEYLGERWLVEYQIRSESLIIQERKNTSWAVVIIVFQRRMEYHVSNTILQTLIMVATGSLSFFFRVDNFQDRIMVTLTVM